jgi:itaconate CoA-transferase
MSRTISHSSVVDMFTTGLRSRAAPSLARTSLVLAAPSRASASGSSILVRHLSASQRWRGAYDFNAPGSRPLEGVTVVALEQVISGPYCTRQLADLGARVIKIERPETGDFVRYHDKRVKGQCSHFIWTNRNKESLALDVKNEEDIAVLRKLLKTADVFVANLVPGATERLGLGYEKLRETNEKLIYCEISGYGSDGPYKKKKAYDLLVQAEAGMVSITGTPNDVSKVGASIADIAAGMYAYSGIMAALLQRAKTGKGCRLDVSMLESMTEWMGFPMYYAYEQQPPPQRAGASHASIYPYGPFEAKDGTVLLGIQNQREWIILCEKVLELPELAKEERFIDTDSRSNNRKELYPIICKALSKYTSEEAVAKLEEAGIANANLNNMEAVWTHPQLHARRRFREMETEAGTVKTMMPPGMSADVEPRLDPVPSIGQHNDKILAELAAQD